MDLASDTDRAWGRHSMARNDRCMVYGDDVMVITVQYTKFFSMSSLYTVQKMCSIYSLYSIQCIDAPCHTAGTIQRSIRRAIDQDTLMGRSCQGANNCARIGHHEGTPLPYHESVLTIQNTKICLPEKKV